MSNNFYVIGRGVIFSSNSLNDCISEFMTRNGSIDDSYLALGIIVKDSDGLPVVTDILVSQENKIKVSEDYIRRPKAVQDVVIPYVNEFATWINHIMYVAQAA